MRKLLFTIIALLAVSIVVDKFATGRGISKVEILRDGINNCRMLTAVDPDYGYEILYPEFFECCDANNASSTSPYYIKDNNITPLLCYRFRNETNIVVDTFLVNSPKTMLAQASSIKKSNNEIIIHGQLKDKSGGFDSYMQHTKLIKKGKVWIAYRVIYEKEYEESVARIVDTIDRWQA